MKDASLQKECKLVTNPTGNHGTSHFSLNDYLFSVIGSTGRVYLIDASVNLTNWTTLATLTNLTGTIQFRDNASTNLPRRFYRGREMN